ncbi:MAG: FG-GAP repeat protein [Deltaproteobacteria bacterium]|nr:FG-GAP repeat protein [Deltaproteobacteria bacterium]
MDGSSAALLCVLLAACGGSGKPGEKDADSDGWTVTGGDCDDADATRYPGAPEVAADGIDQDCNGGDACYEDADRDGWGSTVVIPSGDLACSVPGESETSTDCGDGDPNMHPGAPEIPADGRDQDCDGGDTCFLDNDGDGYGGTSTIASSDLDCRDSGESTGATDCDDTAAGVHPGAGEICGDGVDNDCDGVSEACGPSGETDLSLATAKLVGERSCDLAGRSVAMADVNGDGFDDAIVGAEGSSAGGGYAGTVFCVRGPIDGSWDLSRADAKLVGEQVLDFAGGCIETGDLDEDGFPDILVGARGANGHSVDGGAVYVVRGPVSGWVDLSVADAKLVGEETGGLAGRSIDTEDLDGDGVPDVLVGASGSDAAGLDAGAVHLVHGPVDGTVGLASAGALLLGEAAGDEAGVSVAAGDLDGDGVLDVMVGASGSDAGETDAGAVYGVRGPVRGTVDLAFADTVLWGTQEDESAGDTLLSADLDGDGRDDLIVGAGDSDASGQEDSGTVYLVLGPISEDGSLSEAHGRLTGGGSGDHARSVAVGDLDGDGVLDIVVGAEGADAGGTGSGTVHLVYGPVSGTISLDSADATFIGEEAVDAAGGSVALGDHDGDGRPDLLIGARFECSGGKWAGAAYLVRSGGPSDSEASAP